MADKQKNVIRQVVAIGIGAALFVALTTVQIPVGFVPNVALQVRAAVLAFFAAVFGPVAGFAIGLMAAACLSFRSLLLCGMLPIACVQLK